MNESLRDDEKIFGKYENIDDKHFDLLSHVTIIVKQTINASRMEYSIPSFERVITKIREVEAIERRIALKNSKYELHVKKWERLSSIISTTSECDIP